MINVTINGVDLKFKTTKGLFSPNQVDKGTLAMISILNFSPDEKVLDLGCGYGVVGILAAKLIGERKVFMSDVDEKALELAKLNCELNGVCGVQIFKSNGFQEILEKDFTMILSNPPYHEDFSVAKEFIEKGFNRLKLGGRLYMVTRREKWYSNKLKSIFGGVKIFKIEDYLVFMAEKRSLDYFKKTKKKRP